jgi:transcriptional regulator with XRE-family HTH domain
MYHQGTPGRACRARGRHTLDVVDERQDLRHEVREFLTTRRARITPDQVGLPSSSSRRVPGLRRSEVASLAGLSVEYYARLERGQIAGASAGVLDALARALQLDETERAHLLDLARAADGIPTSGRARRRTTTKGASRPSLRWAMEAITDGVAFVRDPRQNLLATNTLGRAFYSPVIGDGGRTPNLARFQFLDPASRDFYPDWDLFARMCVAIMRTEAGRDPHDRALQDLVGELSTQSETFRRLWAEHDVRTHGAGTKRFHHPVVGELTLAYEELAVTAEPGLVLMVCTAEPGSPSAEGLRLLASWATPPELSTASPRPS